jgi:hypothetical protein
VDSEVTPVEFGILALDLMLGDAYFRDLLVEEHSELDGAAIAHVRVPDRADVKRCAVAARKRGDVRRWALRIVCPSWLTHDRPASFPRHRVVRQCICKAMPARLRIHIMATSTQ